MSMIKVSNLTFNYDDSLENIFENVSFVIDTDWKLGLIGRNGKGKTTLLKLLMNECEYKGTISSDVDFDYFPLVVENDNLNSYELASIYVSDYEDWKLEREISLLNMDKNILSRSFNTLSKGEQTKILLAILFIKENNFLLIDEPTNHLDYESRELVSKYLKKKKGFILISHDRNFLDSCIDHVLSINRNSIDIQKGNFSSWYQNKQNQDNYELAENARLKKEIANLEQATKRLTNWSKEIESSKYRIKGDLLKDKGYIGHQSAKMMKRAINVKNRKEKDINEKNKLLKNIEIVEDLKLFPLNNRLGRLVEVQNLSIKYNDISVVNKLNFYLENGDRLLLRGKNGSGKSSILKLIVGDNIKYSGNLYIMGGLKISYISQDTSNLRGTLSIFSHENNIDDTLFKSILRKLDFSREQFDKPIENYSEGQKKKVLIAKSLCEQANIYVWDEPLNYIDIFSIMQIEELLLKYKPTMIFVDHDKVFSDKISTKIVEL